MALINVTPLTDITAQIASDSVNPGDVLLLEEGIYFQTVIIPKNNIKIIAKGPGVVFDGRSSLVAAFTLSNVTGVVIEGIQIRHYRLNGIMIDGGSGNRIIKNTINNVLNAGIEALSSSSNLIWKNEICKCNDGIRLNLTSTNNRVIDNIVKECTNAGYATILNTDSSNAFVSNKAIGNRFLAFDLFGDNNLLYDNLIQNGQGIRIGDGTNAVVIGNIIKDSRQNGFFITLGYRNYFIGENHISCNRVAGILDEGRFGMIYHNKISYNGDFGIFLNTTINNLVMDNILVCNLPENISDNGSDNTFINNIQKPCEPSEAPGTVCGDCVSEAGVKNG